MKKILKSLVMITVMALVLTAFTACELNLESIKDKVQSIIGGEQPVCVHEIVTDEAVDPTCTETGLTEGYHCGKCGEVILKQFTVKALGHKKGTPATCTEAAICSVCGEHYGEPEGHQFADATCQAPATCKVCGETEGEVDPSNHVFDEEGKCPCGQAEQVVVYFKNTDAWNAVNIYAWIDGEDGATKLVGEWPGAAMTAVGSDWYGVMFEVPTGEDVVVNIIFNSGAGEQTANRVFDPANIFWAKGVAYASVKAAEEALASDTTVYSEWYVRGDMNGWGTGDRLVLNEDGTASITMTFTEGQKFKVANADWSKQFNTSHLAGNSAFGGSGDIEVLVSGTYVVTVSADGSSVTIVPAE